MLLLLALLLASSSPGSMATLHARQQLCDNASVSTAESSYENAPNPAVDQICQSCPMGTVNCDAALDWGAIPPPRPGAGCVDLSSSVAHCGNCGTSCPTGSTCNAGVCECVLRNGVPSASYYCNNATKTFEACPSGKANVDVLTDVGVAASDCELDLLTDVNHCGQMDVGCASGETCTNGVCQCGSNPACTDPATPYCLGGTCKQCDDTSSSQDVCRHDFINNQYCASGGLCLECPENRMDCDVTGDVGASSDCETVVNVTGATMHCGTCGMAVGFVDHPALTCSAGRVVCGRFANNSVPTPQELAQARTCGEGEYCDEYFKECLPLASYPSVRNCFGGAVSPTAVGSGSYASIDMTHAGYCASCNANVSMANLRKGANGAVERWGCLEFLFSQCGSLTNSSCRWGETCIEGRCGRFSSDNWLGWTPYDDVIPDDYHAREVIVKYGSGCNTELVVDVAQMFADAYSASYARSFMSCARLRNDTVYLTVTYDDFSNKTRRDAICSGSASRPVECPSFFCDALFANATAHRDQFCSLAQNSFAMMDRCTREARFLLGADAGGASPGALSTKPRDDKYQTYRTCLTNAYEDDDQASLVVNTAVFYRCPALQGAADDAIFDISSSTFRYLGKTNRAPVACSKLMGYTYGGGVRSTTTSILGVMMMMMVVGVLTI